MVIDKFVSTWDLLPVTVQPICLSLPMRAYDFLCSCLLKIQLFNYLSLQVLVACGDPHQLPPTIMSPSMAESSDDPQDLSRTLFGRLSTAGLEPILVSNHL